MTSVLEKICADKRAYVRGRKNEISEDVLTGHIKTASPPRGFMNALLETQKAGRHAIIAEIKQASPSKGIIREDFDPVMLAQAYQEGGATCLSILTDEPYFMGQNVYLEMAREAAKLPILRKDFIVDPWQVLESRALGADCILLILAALTDDEAQTLESLAISLGMDVLIEIHNKEELQRAFAMKSPLIGINNRNLKTLKVDLSVTKTLASKLPDHVLAVSESGLYTRADLDLIAKLGIHSFLIGESLMREPDVKKALQQLLD